MTMAVVIAGAVLVVIIIVCVCCYRMTKRKRFAAQVDTTNPNEFAQAVPQT